MFAACVYCVWRERNARILRDKRKRWEEVYCNVVDVVKIKMMGLRVKDSAVVRNIVAKWNVQFIVYMYVDLIKDLLSMWKIG